MNKRIKRKKMKALYLRIQPLFDGLNSLGWKFPKADDKPWRVKYP